MINLKKEDAVADSIKSILEKKELSPKQKQIAKMSPPADEIDAGDLAKLRAGHKPAKGKEVAEEIDPKNTTVDTLAGREKKSKNPFLSKKVFMDVPGDVKEEAEQIDELKKSTVKSYIAKKSENLPGKDPKKDMKSMMSAHHRITGVKPTSEEVEQVEEAEKWIQKAIKKPGALKAQLHVPSEKKIPAGKLAAAAEKGGKLGQRARLAMTLKKFKEENEEHSIYTQMINEVLSKDASAGDWIHDFVHSDNPKFAGKSKEMRKKMALAAYYAKQKNEGVDESANPFSPDYKSQMKTKPGAKAGFDSKKVSTGTVFTKKYKKDDEEDKKKVTESKRPESDDVPFVTNTKQPPFEGPYKKSPTSVVDKSGAVHTPMSRVKHLAKQAMKKVKTEMIGKTGTSE